METIKQDIADFLSFKMTVAGVDNVIVLRVEMQVQSRQCAASEKAGKPTK